MAYDPFAAQSAALNKRSTLMDLDLGNQVSPRAAAAALSQPQEDPNEERADWYGTGTTNLAGQRETLAANADIRDQQLEQERARAAGAPVKRPNLWGFGG